MRGQTRRSFLAGAGALAGSGLLAGCLGRGGFTMTESAEGGGDGGGAEAVTARPTSTAVVEEEETTSETGSNTQTESRNLPDDFPPTLDSRLPLPMSIEELQSFSLPGGPPKDGIPSIDKPRFEGASKADDRLDPGDVVFGVARNGAVKAYPQNILVWHEICNDELGGIPVSVTYCPLTGTTLGFERGRTTFGVSGRLINNNLVMYDRASEMWWPQVLATSIPGFWNESYPGYSLREFRLIWTTWERWKEQHPNTRVLTEQTGNVRNYDDDPYGTYNPKGGYYSSPSTLFRPINPDERFEPKDVFLGARTPGGAACFRKEALRDQQLMHGEIGETPVTAVYDTRFDTGYVYRNPEQSQFEYRDGQVLDGAGEAFDPDNLPLARIHTFDAMWFAWIGFYPESEVYG